MAGHALRLCALPHGQRRAARLRKRFRRRHLKHFAHTWSAIKSVVGVVVVLAIYSKLQTNFEIISASLLILLYTTVARVSWGQSVAAGSFNQAGYIRYIELKKLLKAEPHDAEMAGLWDLEENLKNTVVRYYVIDIGNSVINLIVFVNLFRNLF